MIALKVEHLSKIYKLYNSPAARLKEALHPFRKSYHRDFYALHDVSFEVKQGETLGIVGQNGSGKSTLLQILAGVVTPSAGSAGVNGKVAALLELGSGFNPEFTGVENIYFQSSILGYTKHEIDYHRDAIIEFAAIGEFITQPVKMYSTGMLVRLAFAIASNVEPDIFIIDEALAVGDEAFQRKCFARIQGLQKKGTTIIFVSHAAGMVVELCQRAILIDHGELILAGVPKCVVSKYHQLLYAKADRHQPLRDEIRRNFLQHGGSAIGGEIENESQSQQEPGRHQPTQVLNELYDPNLKPQSTIVYSESTDYGVRIRDVKITTIDGTRVNYLISGREYSYTYRVEFKQPAHQVRFGMLIKTMSGLEIGGSASSPPKQPIPSIGAHTTVEVQFRFTCLLHQGTYFMNAGVVSSANDAEVYLDRLIDALMFKVQPDEGIFETGVVSFFVEPSYYIEQKFGILGEGNGQ